MFCSQTLRSDSGIVTGSEKCASILKDIHQRLEKARTLNIAEIWPCAPDGEAQPGSKHMQSIVIRGNLHLKGKDGSELISLPKENRASLILVPGHNGYWFKNPMPGRILEPKWIRKLHIYIFI